MSRIVEHGEEIVIGRGGRPVALRVNRIGRGSLCGMLRLDADWDSGDTNAEIARDFGLLP